MVAAAGRFPPRPIPPCPGRGPVPGALATTPGNLPACDAADSHPVVSCMLRPRFVVLLDGGAPISVSLACEFDYHGETYHYGLAGPGTPWDGSAAARAPLAPLRMGRPTARPQRVP